jgi:predicted phage terminase large subunit-like protein
MDFPKQREEYKKLSEALGNPTIYIEEVAYQKALIQQLNDEGLYNVEGVKIDGDKFSRLNLTSHYIKNGTVLFSKTGCDELIYQLTDFGVERYDDLADAFAILVLKIIENYRSKPASFISPSKGSPRPITAGWPNKIW